MALDSIYKIKKGEQQPEINPQKSIKEMKKLIESLPTTDIDQKWVRENEGKENRYSAPSQKNEDEQKLDDILATFKRIREANNNMRAQMRRKQLSTLPQLQETQQWLDNMSRGMSK